jgi:peroxiredoxin Q/BCP
MIVVGEKAPEFSLPDINGTPVSLHDFAHKRLVLVFYPGDDTPGCTAQLCAIRDDAEKFAEAGVTVFGINHADAVSHAKFIEKYGLTARLLIDEGRVVAERYGALGSFMGRPTTSRTVYAIDEEGVIVGAWKGAPDTAAILAVFSSAD